MSDEQVLREAADDACLEVLWHCEQQGEAPPELVAHAEQLLRAVGALSEERICSNN